MNILLPYSEIKKFLQTDASPEEFQKYLSLCGPSIEKIEYLNDDAVFDIEVTTNRIDYASVVGIIQEAVAILPTFDKKAVVKTDLLHTYKFSQVKFGQEVMLHVKRDAELNPRFTACVLDNITVHDSLPEMQNFLKKVGIRSINNVVDISNYLMLLFGQPVHIFDYDKIGGGVMNLRKSQKGEQIFLLDEKKYELPEGAIVIEDQDKKLIDLCGVMGGKLSEIDQNTKRIVLFVQTYNKKNIRLATMHTGARSLASSYFEKGLDSQRVEPTFVYGILLLQQMAKGKVVSSLIDDYEKPYAPKTIEADLEYFQKNLGVNIDKETVTKILNSLSFTTEVKNNRFFVQVPESRYNDVFAKEDLFEEVARIYGYAKIGEELPPFALVSDEQIRESQSFFQQENYWKRILLALGFYEVYNYSMISEKQIKQFGLDQQSLAMNNPMSEELVYFRQSLIPSLVKNAQINQLSNNLRLFESANIYLPRNNDLPLEQKTLAFLFTGGYFELKGVIEALASYANITSLRFEEGAEETFISKRGAKILVNNEVIGYLGELRKDLQYDLGLKQLISVAELNFEALLRNSKPLVLEQAVTNNQSLVEDVTYLYNGKRSFFEITKELKKHFPKILRIEFMSVFKEAISFRIFSESNKGQSILPEIIEFLEKNLHLQLKRSL